jgi:AcrR family transcriptional regulator
MESFWMSASGVRASASRQAERRARSRAALLESAALGLSRYGYANLVLEDVAREAGYTRGALYHQFKDKEDLARAVLQWADETWQREVGDLASQQPDPVSELLAMARGHAVLCRRDIARVAMALRVEFSGQDHPIARDLERVQAGLVKRLVRLINAGRRDGSIPLGPPARSRASSAWTVRQHLHDRHDKRADRLHPGRRADARPPRIDRRAIQ